MKRLLVLATLLLFLIQGCFSQSKSKVIFEKINIYNKVDTSYINDKMSTFYIEYYIISNYKDSKEIDSLVTDFVLKNNQNNFLRYDSYNMLFYKKSHISNKTHLEDSPRDLDRYSQDNDWVYDFSWRGKRKEYVISKYKNGKIVDSKPKVMVSDISNR